MAISTTTTSGCSLEAASTSARPSQTMSTTSNLGSKTPFKASAIILWSSATKTLVRLTFLSPGELRVRLRRAFSNRQRQLCNNFCSPIRVRIHGQLPFQQSQSFRHANQANSGLRILQPWVKSPAVIGDKKCDSVPASTQLDPRALCFAVFQHIRKCFLRHSEQAQRHVFRDEVTTSTLLKIQHHLVFLCDLPAKPTDCRHQPHMLELARVQPVRQCVHIRAHFPNRLQHLLHTRAFPRVGFRQLFP